MNHTSITGTETHGDWILAQMDEFYQTEQYSSCLITWDVIMGFFWINSRLLHYDG